MRRHVAGWVIVLVLIPALAVLAAPGNYSRSWGNGIEARLNSLESRVAALEARLNTTTTQPTTTTTQPTTTTTAATTTTTQATTTTTQATTTTTAPTGVPVLPGQSVQAAVDANPAGTRFIIRAGVHVQQRVVPKDNQRFTGEPGAILDGQNITENAFLGGADGVIIEGLLIRNYNPPLQTGVIRTLGGAFNWTVQNNEFTGNNGAPVYLNTGWRVIGNNIHHNRYAGLFCGGADMLVEGNTIANNNTDRHNPNFEAAGMKCFRTTNLTVRNNTVTDNYGPGLWTDWDNINTLFEGNTVRDNCGPGIFHEASFDAVIRNNLVERNGFCNTAWLDGAGILVNTSKNVTITGNTLRDNNDGIGITYTDRGTSEVYGIREARNILVENNTVVLSTGQTGLVTNLASNDVFSAAWGNRFVGNTYTNNTGSATAYAWNRQSMTWEQWQAAGHDN